MGNGLGLHMQVRYSCAPKMQCGRIKKLQFVILAAGRPQ